MEREAEKVAIVKCSSYEQRKVDKAVEKAISLLDFRFKKGMKVLIKPNVVGVFPRKQIACTTHPSLIEAVCKILKKNNCQIFIGDSPFTNPEPSFRAAGLEKLKKYGKLVIFEQDKQIRIHNEKAKILKNFELAKIILEADLIIDMPKLKTHSLTKYTGAIKNLYGCIPGGLKQRLHNEAHGDKKFSKMLVDIYQSILPQLSIMDGVIGMEGEGPTSGDAKKSGLILASKNSVALDIAACKIIGYNPKRIYAINDAVKRKLVKSYKVEVLGLDKLPRINFKKPTLHQISKTRKLLHKLFRERPIIADKNLCTKCGTCAKHCPVQAITLNPYPEINKKKCIRCFCCIEVCPQDAMMIKQ